MAGLSLLGQLGQDGLAKHMDGQCQEQHQQKEEGVHQAEQPGEYIPPVLLRAVNPVEAGEHAEDPMGGSPQRRQSRYRDQGFRAAGEHPSEQPGDRGHERGGNHLLQNFQQGAASQGGVAQQI